MRNVAIVALCLFLLVTETTLANFVDHAHGITRESVRSYQ